MKSFSICILIGAMALPSFAETAATTIESDNTSHAHLPGTNEGEIFISGQMSSIPGGVLTSKGADVVPGSWGVIASTDGFILNLPGFITAGPDAERAVSRSPVESKPNPGCDNATIGLPEQEARPAAPLDNPTSMK